MSVGPGIVELTFRSLLPAEMQSDEARVMLLAIGQQETAFVTRTQTGGGPGHGYWMFEPGGLRDVFTDVLTDTYASQFSLARGVTPAEPDVYEAILSDDVLACGFARLLLWSDRERPLPAVGDEAGALDLYLRTWRPGADARDPGGVAKRWTASYAAAIAFAASSP